MMKELVCKMCHSNEIVPKDDLYVCESCGTKYTKDEAEKLSVEVIVKNDNAEKISALLKAAKRAREMSNWESAAKYYDEVLGLAPDNWEAVFYSAFCTAYNCKIANIASAARLVHNSLKPTFMLIKGNVSPAEQRSAVADVYSSANAILLMLAKAAENHYNEIDYSIRTKYLGERNDRLNAAANAVADCGIIIDRLFGTEYAEMIKVSLKNALSIGCIGAASKTKCLELLEKYDPAYIENLKAKEIESDAKNFRGGIITLIIGIIALVVTVFVWDDDLHLFLKIFLPMVDGIFILLGAMIMALFKKKSE